MDVRQTWTDCDEAGDYVVPNVLSPKDLVSRPDNMGETVPHTLYLRHHSRRLSLDRVTNVVNTYKPDVFFMGHRQTE